MGSTRRTGWRRLVGPLAPAQSAAVLGTAGACAVLVGTRTARRAGVARGALLGFVALDLVGGLVAFQLRPTREHYGGTPLQSRLTFALTHVQPFAVPLARQGSWRRAAFRYVSAVGSTAALELVLPRAASRRPVANLVGAVLSLVDVASDDSPQRWFGPVYLMKVIGGHGGIPQSARSSATLHTS